MKAILEFELPQEQDQFNFAQHGWKYQAIVSDFREYLRAQHKYLNKDLLTIEELREKLNELEMHYEITNT